MQKLILKPGLVCAAALLSLGVTSTASAQGMSCADVTFNAAVYDRWPFADDACLEIVQRDGGTFARFEAEVVSQTAGGTYVRYTLNDGTQGPSRKANPPAGIVAHIDGEVVQIADLNVRQKVRIYLPENLFAPPAAAPAAAAPPPPAPAPAPEPEPEPMPVALPSTAGAVGWLALVGSLFLMLGGALRLTRKQ